MDRPGRERGAQARERPMATAAYGMRGCKDQTRVSGERPTGATFRPQSRHHAKLPSSPPPPPLPPELWGVGCSLANLPSLKPCIALCCPLVRWPGPDLLRHVSDCGPLPTLL